MVRQPASVIRSAVLGCLFLGHMMAIGLAWLPMFTYLRRHMTDEWMAIATAILPIGGLSSYFISRSLQRWPKWNQTRYRVGFAQLLLAGLYWSIFRVMEQPAEGPTHPSTIVALVGLILLTGCAQPMAFSGLIATGLRQATDLYPLLRSLASLGYIAAGLILAVGLPIDGTQLLAASCVFLIVGLASICVLRDQEPLPVGESTSNVVSIAGVIGAAEVALLALIAMTMAFSEITHNIQTQTLLTQVFGPSGNALIQIGVGIEFGLLLAMPWLRHYPWLRQILFLAGPLGWILVIAGMMSVEQLPWAAISLVGLGLNAPWQTLVAQRLGADPHQQIKLTTAQAAGSLSAYLTTWGLAYVDLPLHANWLAALLVVGSGALVASVALATRATDP